MISARFVRADDTTYLVFMLNQGGASIPGTSRVAAFLVSPDSRILDYVYLACGSRMGTLLAQIPEDPAAGLGPIWISVDGGMVPAPGGRVPVEIHQRGQKARYGSVDQDKGAGIGIRHGRLEVLADAGQ